MRAKSRLWREPPFADSSLLNILLDTQAPAIRGLGEVPRRRRKGWSLRRLQYDVKHCRLYSRWDGKDFYEFNFQYYGCRTLDRFLETHEPALCAGWPANRSSSTTCCTRARVPHAAAHSILKHWQHDDLGPAALRRETQTSSRPSRCGSRRTSCIWTNPPRASGGLQIRPLRRPGRDPAAAVEDICHWLGRPVQPRRVAELAIADDAYPGR